MKPYYLTVPISGLAALLVASCADPGDSSFRNAQTQRLSHDLWQLAPTVRPSEADKLAATAIEESAKLSIKYDPVRLPWFNNFLVNRGLRDRGLCYQWRNDLFPHLYRLKPKSLELHLATCRKGTMLEHNGIVVTAKGQPFQQGIILDPWRGSGRLWWGRVDQDKRYPWAKQKSKRTPLSLRPLLMPKLSPPP